MKSVRVGWIGTEWAWKHVYTSLSRPNPSPVRKGSYYIISFVTGRSGSTRSVFILVPGHRGRLMF